VPYLSTATNGVFELRVGTLPNGLPEYNAVDPETRARGDKSPNPELAWERLAIQPEAVQFLSDLYGPYPFESVGAIVDWAPNVFYSLESQTKPNYWRIPSEETIVHELAHQWFGDALVIEEWPEMWLNEGFATWSEWIWTERHGGKTAHQQFLDLYNIEEGTSAFQDLWFPPPAAIPDPSQLFGTPVYDRGAMTLQALRDKLADDTTFFQILRDWYAEHRYSNVVTADFIALAERDSGQQLDQFFQVWLYDEGRPASW
jgi:aminopeptidase N